MKSIKCLIVALLTFGLFQASQAAPASEAQLLDARKIWDAGDHNAFTDLIRWHDRWWCV